MINTLKIEDLYFNVLEYGNTGDAIRLRIVNTEAR